MIFFQIFQAFVRFFDFFPVVSEKRGIHEEFHIAISMILEFVNGLRISCEDVFRSFEESLEKESVENFFWSLYSSHEVTRLFQTDLPAN